MLLAVGNLSTTREGFVEDRTQSGVRGQMGSVQDREAGRSGLWCPSGLWGLK